jgi:hypothetical protein
MPKEKTKFEIVNYDVKYLKLEALKIWGIQKFEVAGEKEESEAFNLNSKKYGREFLKCLL